MEPSACLTSSKWFSRSLLQHGNGSDEGARPQPQGPRLAGGCTKSGVSRLTSCALAMWRLLEGEVEQELDVSEARISARLS